MIDILNIVQSGFLKKTQRQGDVDAFVSEYSLKNISDIDWIPLCAAAEKYKCYKFSFLVMRELLNRNLYTGSYAEFLYENLDFYNAMDNLRFYSFKKFMCGCEISRQIIFKCISTHIDRPSQWYSCIYVNTENRFFKSLLTQFINSRKNQTVYTIEDIMFVFEESLGGYRSKISSIKDFNSKTFFTQVEFYKTHFADNEAYQQQALTVVVNFYRWLTTTYPEHNFFEATFDMSEHVLFAQRLALWLFRGYYFTTLTPTNIPYGQKRICFLLKGFDRYSTRIINDDYVTIDLSSLQSSFYRDLLIEFVVTTANVSRIKGGGVVAQICDAIQALYEVKQTDGYPNKKLDYLTNQEAIFIRKYVEARDISIPSKNNQIGAVRSFLSFCRDKGVIKTDDLCFNYLFQYETPNKNLAKTVPDDVLVALHKALLEKSKGNLLYKEMFAIFHLTLQTEFRISQICHLKVDCIKPTIKPNQFMIQTNSKTSYGRKNSYVISALTYNILMGIIEETERAREDCCVDNFKDYIFVYENKKNGIAKPVLFNSPIFLRHLKLLCTEIGVEPLNATQLRDTHMTKSLEYIMRNGKSDLEMSVLSKHKHIDTTKNHYIEMELEKMLESTYGIIIGKELINADSKIVNDIPDHLASKENDVEGGCGKCTAETCVMTNSLPCLVCDNFITTTKHEVFFKKAIENVTRLIEKTKNCHDREDLVTIKTLYVLYLKAIIKHKEELTNHV